MHEKKVFSPHLSSEPEIVQRFTYATIDIGCMKKENKKKFLISLSDKNLRLQRDFRLITLDTYSRYSKIKNLAITFEYFTRN